MSFELIHSETLMKGRAFTIRRDTMKTPDGRETKFEIIEHNGSVIIIPIDALGNILFVRQYRHAAETDMLEFPAGTRNEGESFKECAIRELREETGYAASQLQKVGVFFLAPGYSTEFMVVYLAEELSYSPLKADIDEFLKVERIPIGKILEVTEKKGIKDAKTLAALFLARNFLGLNRT